jgi:hypothetical protein
MDGHYSRAFRNHLSLMTIQDRKEQKGPPVACSTADDDLSERAVL